MSTCIALATFGIVVTIAVCLEHWVSSKSRNGSRNVGGCAERHNSNHGQSSIVQFTILLDLHGGIIDRGKVNRWEDDGWGLSSLGVVGSVGFRDDFSKEDQANDLLLS